MHKLFILLISIPFWNYNKNCSINEYHFEIGINILFEKKILTETTDTLFVAFFDDINFGKNMPDEILINSKILKIDYSKTNYPCIWIKDIYDSREKDEKKYIDFHLATQGGRITKGSFEFECIEGKFRYADCYYYSFLH